MSNKLSPFPDRTGAGSRERPGYERLRLISIVMGDTDAAAQAVEDMVTAREVAEQRAAPLPSRVAVSTLFAPSTVQGPVASPVNTAELAGEPQRAIDNAVAQAQERVNAALAGQAFQLLQETGDATQAI